MNTAQHLETVKRFDLIADKEREIEDKHYNGSDAAIESLKQGATSMRALVEYLKEKGYDGEQMWQIFKAHGATSTSGFKNMILFLERAFDTSEARVMPAYIQAAQTDIALNEALGHIREIAAYLEIHGGIDEEEGRQIIGRAKEFAAGMEYPETPDEKIKCDKNCDLRRFYDNNGNRCCKLWREVNIEK